MILYAGYYFVSSKKIKLFRRYQKMKSTIKFTATIILTITLFYSSAFACGEMGNGSKSCPDGNGGGLIENQPTITVVNDKKAKNDTQNDLLSMIQKFLVSYFA